MKIYLASKFNLKDDVQYLSNLLEEEGHEITVKWWEKDFKKEFGEISDDEWYTLPDIESVCSRNFRGIDEADVVILIASLEAQKFNGANIEMGYALAKGKKVMSIGKIERSAMYWGIKKYPHMNALLMDLRIGDE